MGTYWGNNINMMGYWCTWMNYSSSQIWICRPSGIYPQSNAHHSSSEVRRPPLCNHSGWCWICQYPLILTLSREDQEWHQECKLPTLLDFTVKWGDQKMECIRSNVNPGLINPGLLIRGGTLPIVIIQYLNGTPPIKQPRGLLIQGWHYIGV